jgi:NTP pyrophosphatase (non-canonical NTP hydrolase)
MDEAARYLREQLFDAESRLAQAEGERDSEQDRRLAAESKCDVLMEQGESIARERDALQARLTQAEGETRLAATQVLEWHQIASEEKARANALQARVAALEGGWRQAVVAIHATVIKAWPAWSDEDRRFLALALAGEVGELLNVVKKAWRGDDDPSYEGKIAEELADARIYLELLARAHGMDLDAACTEVVRTKLRARWPQCAPEIDAALGAAGAG